MFSPDGSRIITSARDGTARFWNADSGQQLFVLPQPGEVHTGLFSPDGTRILTASSAREPTLWDAKTGNQVSNIQSTRTQSGVFSPDGLTFATAADSVQIWRTRDGTELKTMPFLTRWSNKVAFSPDGGRLFTISWGSPAHLWSVSTGEEIAVLSGAVSENNCATFGHDGKLAASASSDGSAHLWNGLSGALLRVLGKELPTFESSGTQDEDRNCAFSPDDQFFANVALNGILRIWEVKSGLLLKAIGGAGNMIRHVAFGPDRDSVLFASSDGNARVWDIDGILTTTLAQNLPPKFALFSPDGKQLVTGGGDNVVHMWDLAGREVRQLVGREARIQQAAISANGDYLATTSGDGRLSIWDTKSGHVIAELAAPGTSTALGTTTVDIEFSPDGALLSSTSTDGVSRIWRLATGTQVAALTTTGILRRAIFSPDGKFVLTVKGDEAQLSTIDGAKYQTLSGNRSPVSAAVFSPEGQFVATGTLDGIARICSIKDGSPVAILEGHTKALLDVAFSHDGKSLVTASRDGTARLWNMADGTAETVLRGHSGGINSVAFSPNDRFIVTASSQDRTVRLWEAKSGRQIALLSAPSDASTATPALTTAAFNSDGTEIAIVSGDQNARAVHVFPQTQDLIDYARTIVPRDLTPCEREHFFLATTGKVGECSN
ncbi:MAG: WD40 repeat domain-containing protein [Hyphomicrobiales bacterium]